MKYIYTVWFLDASLGEEDPDYEWPACFVVEAVNEAKAQQWGDRLAQNYASANGQVVLRSITEVAEDSSLPGCDSLPVVQEGAEITNEQIGW